MIASLAALFLTLYTANQLCLNVGFGSRLCENSNRAGFWELQDVSRSADRRLWAVLCCWAFAYYRQIRVFTQPRPKAAIGRRDDGAARNVLLGCGTKL